MNVLVSKFAKHVEQKPKLFYQCDAVSTADFLFIYLVQKVLEDGLCKHMTVI